MSGPATKPDDEQQPLSRVARKRSQRIDAILNVAAQVVSEHGYHNTSLEMVADRVDLTKASLYHYFDSKDDLFSACFQAVAEKTIARLAAVANAAPTPLDALRDLILEQLEIFVHDDPHMARLFLQHQDWPESMREEQRHWRRQHEEIFVAVVEDGVASGQLHPRDPRVALHCMHGSINFVPIWFRSRTASEDRKVLTLVTESILDIFR
ncbi:TetR/AcrR family transcriptional regulator [Nocardioides caldifontis]|uniref:TetR/AcrR family transcriptional regulator n=1 Tax=Nocardioides caldifontis TaxID=2588938 RepID=UPI0011DFA3AE|nr:TetR/AcrR family transcriptional regulator [Nocardioides caldifontis]